MRGALLRRTFGPEGGGGLWHKQHHAHSPPAQCPQTYAVRGRRRKDGTLERSRRRRKGPLLEEAVSQKFCLLKELLETPSPFSPLSVLRFLRLLLRRQSLSSSIFPSLACQCHRRRQCQLKTLLCLLLFPTPPSLAMEAFSSSRGVKTLPIKFPDRLLQVLHGLKERGRET